MKHFSLHLLLVICCFSIGLFFVFPAFAATFSLSSSQANLQIADTFNVDANLSINAKDGTVYYLRGIFYQDGTTAYCGFTWNGSSWFSGPYSSNNGWENFLPITITNSSWSGQVQAKIDITNNSCQKNGNYNFKIERFTSCGSSSYDDQNILVVNFFVPTPTITPVPTATPTKIPTPTPTLKPTPTFKPTSTDKSTATATTKPVSSLKPTATFIPATSTILPTTLAKEASDDDPTNNATSASEVLGVSTAHVTEPTLPSVKNQTMFAGVNEKQSSSGGQGQVFVTVIIIGGILFLVSGILLIWRRYRQKNYE